MANECNFFLEFKGPNVPKDSTALSNRLGTHPDDAELALGENTSLYQGYCKWRPPEYEVIDILSDPKFDITSCTIYWEEMCFLGAGVLEYREGKEVSRDYLDSLAPKQEIRDFTLKHPLMGALLLDAN
jgi:hypothetical protein